MNIQRVTANAREYSPISLADSRSFAFIRRGSSSFAVVFPSLLDIECSILDVQHLFCQTPPLPHPSFSSIFPSFQFRQPYGTIGQYVFWPRQPPCAAHHHCSRRTEIVRAACVLHY